MPYVLVGMLTLGAGLGAGLGLTAGPMTYAPTPVAAVTITCSMSSISSINVGSSFRSNFVGIASNSYTPKPHCVVSGAGSKVLDQCLSKVASARGTVTPNLPRPQVAACEHQFGDSGGGTITFASPPTRTTPKGLQTCAAKEMKRVKLTSGAAMQQAFNTVVSTCERQIGLPKP